MQQRKKLKQSLALLAAPLAVLSNHSFAQETAAEKSLPPVVVTASRAPRTLGEDIADITVITREEIERAGQSNLGDILQRQPGIEMGRNGGAGNLTSIFMRGTESRHVLVLIDGVRLSNPSLTGVSWESLSLGNVDRIEILRGPASGLYGSDAIGGVIQIFTKKSQAGANFGASVGYGSYGLRKRDVSFSGRSGSFGASFSAGAEKARGFSATNVANSNFNPDRDGYARESYQLSTDYSFMPGHVLNLFATKNRINAQYDSGSGDHRNIRNVSTEGAQLRNDLTQNWLSTLSLSSSKQAYTTLPYSVFNESRVKQNEWSWQNDWSFGATNLQALVGHRNERVATVDAATFSMLENQSRKNDFLGFLVQQRIQNLSLQANVRHENDSSYGGIDTGSVGFGYLWNKNWRLTGSYGTAFRAPNLDALYGPFGPNPNLRPERSRDAEMSLRYSEEHREVSLTVFENEITDLIGYTTQYVNINKARIRGVSLAWKQGWKQWTSNLAIDYLDPADLSNNKILPRRARRKASADITYAWNNTLHSGLEWLYQGPRSDIAGQNPSMGGYQTFNVYMTYQFEKDWQLLARWNNVFDKKYELARYYQTPGSNGFIELSYQFSSK